MVRGDLGGLLGLPVSFDRRVPAQRGGRQPRLLQFEPALARLVQRTSVLAQLTAPASLSPPVAATVTYDGAWGAHLFCIAECPLWEYSGHVSDIVKCPLMTQSGALSGHSNRSKQCPLSGVKRGCSGRKLCMNGTLGHQRELRPGEQKSVSRRM